MYVYAEGPSVLRRILREVVNPIAPCPNLNHSRADDLTLAELTDLDTLVVHFGHRRTKKARDGWVALISVAGPQKDGRPFPAFSGRRLIITSCDDVVVSGR